MIAKILNDELIDLAVQKLTCECDADIHARIHTHITDMTRAEAYDICRVIQKKVPDAHIINSLCDQHYVSVGVATFIDPLKIGREFRFIPNQINTRSRLVYYGSLKHIPDASGTLNFSRISPNELRIETYWE